MSRCRQIEQSVERIDRNVIRCVLSCEKKLYIIFTDSCGENYIVRARWNIYQGFQYLDESVPPRVTSFADSILHRHMSDVHHYPLCGEWYEIKAYTCEEKTRWRIRRSGGRRKTGLLKCLSTGMQYLIAVIFSLLVYVLHRDAAASWLHSVLPYFKSSTLELIILIGHMTGITLLFCWFDRYRDFFDLYFNACLPIGLVITIGMMKCILWMRIVVPLGFVAACLMAAFCMGSTEGRVRLNGEYFRLALIILLVFTLTLSSTGGLHADTDTTKMEYMISEEAERIYLQTCEKLESETWDDMTSRERLDVLQIICDYECVVVLGCEPVRVESGVPVRSTILGQYNGQTRRCLINESHLKRGDVDDVLETALHEVRHAYQNSLTEMYSTLEEHISDKYKNLYPFRQAKLYAAELANYCSGEENYQKYYSQEVEKDCRAWAETRLNEFYIDYIFPQE